MDKFKNFLENGKWKQMKKSDWAVLALAGVLLLIIALPTGGKNSGTSFFPAEEKNTQAEGGKEAEGKAAETAEGEEDAYAAYLEKKLETVLSRMDGVGNVKVMVTVSDNGERVVEKDVSGKTTTTQETDSTGGSRTVTENNTEKNTVYVETGDETYPYVQKEKLPSVEGVVVVAEGGGNSKVVSDISDTIKALFPIEAHRIKVVKMCSKEEST